MILKRTFKLLCADCQTVVDVVTPLAWLPVDFVVCYSCAQKNKEATKKAWAEFAGCEEGKSLFRVHEVPALLGKLLSLEDVRALGITNIQSTGRDLPKGA